VSLEERPPRRSLASLRRWFDAVILEDPLDRVAPDHVPEESHPIADSGVAPSRVLLGQANHQGDEMRLGSSARLALPRTVVLRGDQAPIPAQDRIRCDDPGEVAEESPSRELLSEDAILLEEVVDHLGLSAIHPAGNHEDEELDRWSEKDHARASIAPRPRARGAVQALISALGGVRRRPRTPTESAFSVRPSDGT